MKYISFMLFFFLLIISSCGKTSNTDCHWAAPPSDLLFIIKYNEKIYPDSILNNLKIYYLQAGNKKYLTYFGRAATPYKESGVMVAQNVDILSSTDTIKNYFIEYPYAIPSDSFYIEYAKPSTETNCLYKLKNIMFNKINNVEIDTSFKLSLPVYIFSK